MLKKNTSRFKASKTFYFFFKGASNNSKIKVYNRSKSAISMKKMSILYS